MGGNSIHHLVTELECNNAHTIESSRADHLLTADRRLYRHPPLTDESDAPLIRWEFTFMAVNDTADVRECT